MKALVSGFIQRVLLLCLVIVLNGAVISSVFASEILMPVEHWPPWEVAEDPEHQVVSRGIAVELAREIFLRYGKDIQLQTVPWKRALFQMKHGLSDIIPMISRSEERQEYLEFTQPIFSDPIVFAYKPSVMGEFKWSEWKDLQQYMIGIVHDYEYGQNWDMAVKKYNLRTESANRDLYNLKKLMAGRYDLTLQFRSVAKEILKSFPDDHGILLDTKPISQRDFYFAISKKSPLVKDIQVLDQIISDMKADGSYARIMRNEGQ
jgi:polar amino acid transport system substrate-binding protein